MRPACRNINYTVIKVTTQIAQLKLHCSRVTFVRLRAAWGVNIWWFDLTQNNIARIARLRIFENLESRVSLDWKKTITNKNRVILTYEKYTVLLSSMRYFRVSGCLLSPVISVSYMTFVRLCMYARVHDTYEHIWDTWRSWSTRCTTWNRLICVR